MQTLVANIGYAVSEWMLETPATVVYEQVHGCPNTNLRMARDNGSRRTGVVLLCMGVGGVGMHSVTARSFVDSAIRRGFRCFALDMHTSKHTPAEWAEDDELHRVVMFLAQTHPRLPLFAVGHSCGALRLTTLCIRKTTPIRAICCMAHPLELRRAIHMIRRHPGCRWWFSDRDRREFYKDDDACTPAELLSMLLRGGSGAQNFRITTDWFGGHDT